MQSKGDTSPEKDTAGRQQGIESPSQLLTLRRPDNPSDVLGLLNPFEPSFSGHGFKEKSFIGSDFHVEPPETGADEARPSDSSGGNTIRVFPSPCALTAPQIEGQRDLTTAPAHLTPDKMIDIHFLFTLGHESENNAWEYLDLAINVTQNYEKDPMDDAPPPENSAQTSQHLYKRTAPGGKHVKEIAVRICVKNLPTAIARLYKFQLFCSLKENSDMLESMRERGVYAQWTRVECCVFVSNPETRQALRPISKDIPRCTIVNLLHPVQSEAFLGSIAFDGINLFHLSPNATSLAEKGESFSTPSTHSALHGRNNKVVVVEECDMVRERRRARAGRPSHRLTGDLLMTQDQADKVLEIRNRWRGRTARQRRNHVSEIDFYSFFTLNRDEAAKVLPVCTTWFKDVIRLHGVKVWPGRPLRRSGALLEDLKSQLRSEEAALQYTSPNTPDRFDREQKIASLKCEVEKVLSQRLAIVKKYVTPTYFENFLAAGGGKYLDPTWEALPPRLPTEPKEPQP